MNDPHFVQQNLFTEERKRTRVWRFIHIWKLNIDMLASIIVRCEKILKLGIPSRPYIFKGVNKNTRIVCWM